jgi:hypothetical protein
MRPVDDLSVDLGRVAANIVFGRVELEAERTQADGAPLIRAPQASTLCRSLGCAAFC